MLFNSIGCYKLRLFPFHNQYIRMYRVQQVMYTIINDIYMQLKNFFVVVILLKTSYINQAFGFC